MSARRTHALIKTKHSTRSSKGFTIVELMFSMAFLGFLMLFIIAAIIQLIGTYNKGLVYKEINQSGRTIIEELTRNIRVSSPSSINSTQVEGGLDRGRVCLAGQAYVWNTPTTNPRNRYTAATGGAEITGVIRVNDTAGTACIPNMSGALPAIDANQQVVLARSNVAIHRFSLQRADAGRLINFSVVFSSTGDNAPVPATDECPAGRLGEYCAVAAFNNVTVATRK